MTESQSQPQRHGVIVRSQLLSAHDVSRAVRRMAHEILEHHHDQEELVVLGLQSGGAGVAARLSDDLVDVGAVGVQRGMLDVAYFRDDLDRHPLRGASTTSIPVDITDRAVLLVDDVLFTGRTARAALQALAEWGRPRMVELAVLVDRGHREVPIRPDYVGKNLPTSRRESIIASLEGVWIGDEVDS